MSNVIKLSNETIEVLNNFANINNSLAFKKGSELRTISNAGSIECTAIIEEVLPKDFNILNLSRFLSVLNLDNLRGGELDFSEDGYVVITKNDAKTRYNFTDSKFTEPPQTKLPMPSIDLAMLVTENDLDNILRAAKTLSHNHIMVGSEGGKKFIKTYSIKVDNNKTQRSDVYTHYINDDQGEFEDCSFIIDLNNVKLLKGDYLVQLSNMKISRFTHQSKDVVYHVALWYDV